MHYRNPAVLDVGPPLLPTFVIPDARIGEALVAQVQSIDSFAAVAAWDKSANEFVSYAKSFLSSVPSIEHQINVVEQHGNQIHTKRGFFERVFSTAPMAAEIRSMRQQLRTAVPSLSSLVAELEALIDQTPDTPAEKKVLLAELRAQKKALTQEKRELNLAMREVRTNARRASARAYNGVFVSARTERLGIRLQKEAELKPHEDEKAAIERRLLSLERLILWVERIN